MPRRADPAGLGTGFYARPVVEVARDLIGCTMSFGGCSGVIVETEAYHQSEPACHAHIGLTARTRTLFARPGLAYVYRSYGIHALINAVCEPEGVGAAVLIRALEPLAGLEEMQARRGLHDPRELCSGPGKLTQAMGIGLHHDGCDLARGPVCISGPREGVPAQPVSTDRRIGITPAVELRWRFCATGSRYLSRPVSRAWGEPRPAMAGR